MPEFDKNVPIPPAKAGCGKRSYFLWDMAVGDSRLVTGVERNVLSARISDNQKRSGFRSTTRKEDGGYRVWRTA